MRHPFRGRLLITLLLGTLAAVAPPAQGQSLGTIRWRLAPFCDVLTLEASARGPAIALTGVSESCGGAPRPVWGTAVPDSPPGQFRMAVSIGPDDPTEHRQVIALVDAASLTGPWKDASSSQGQLELDPVTPAPGAPLGSAGSLFLGSGVGHGGESDTIRIGSSQTRAFVAGLASTQVEGFPACVGEEGQVGICPLISSVHLKEDVAPVADPSRLLALTPVSFRYRPGVVAGERRVRYGLLAEEVAGVYPELARLSAEGLPVGVRDDALPVLLLAALRQQAGEIAALRRAYEEVRDRLERAVAGLEAARGPAGARERP